MKFKSVFILLLALCSFSFAQRLYKISVQINGEEKSLSFVVKGNVDYVSVKELSALLFADQYYNSEAAKIEIKFKEYSLKFTARNQFVILNHKSDGAQFIFQIPLSTLLIKEDVFIPLVYCVDYLSLGFGKRLEFDSYKKNLKVTDEIFDSENLFASKQSLEKEEKPVESDNTLAVKSKYDISSI
jgi:hypothetical protein